MHEDFEEIKCIICGSKERKLLSRKGQFRLPVFVSICCRCGLVYLNPRWIKEKYNEYYNKEYDHISRNKIFTQEFNEDCYKDGKIIHEMIKNYLPTDFNFCLEAGAGMGWTLGYFKEKYPQLKLYAIEPSVYCQKNIVEKINAKIITSDLDHDWQISYKDRFDLVILNMVLEHLLDPLAVLKKINYAMSVPGLLYIEVPNMMRPKKKGSLNNYWYRAPHTYYFSQETLLVLLSRAGFKPVAINAKGHVIKGVFKKGKFDPLFKSVYNNQMMAIRKFKFGYAMYFLSSLPLKILKNLMPASIKVKLKNYLVR